MRRLRIPYNDIIKLKVLMNISPSLTVSRSFEQVLPWVHHQLHRAGLRGIQTFNLRTARIALHDCECPHHGTDQCDCQMVVLLVYGRTEEPATLILHGNDGTTWLSITASAGRNHDLDQQIRLALQIHETA